MLLSYCIPCHRRVADLQASLGGVISAANASPPVQIVLVDYGIQDTPRGDLASVVAPFLPALAPENLFTRVKSLRYAHYHMTHARNVGIKFSLGDYVIVTAADIRPKASFFATVREALLDEPVWLRPDYEFIGVVVVQRAELLAAGGFDERIEFYGSDDKDLKNRLTLRGGRCVDYVARDHLTMWRTRNKDKVAHYRLHLTKTEMLTRGSAILEDNVRRGALVVNEGIEWGIP